MRETALKLYLSKRAQFVFLTLVAAMVGAVYFLSHLLLYKSYWAEISDAANSAFQVFRVAPATDGAQLELRAGGAALDPARLPAIPFGLEKMASIQGTLSEFAERARQANQSYQARRDAFLSRFSSRSGYRWLQLSELGSSNALDELRIPNPAFERLQAAQGRNFREAFLHVLQGTVVFDASLNGGFPATGRPPAETSRQINQATAVSIVDAAHTAMAAGERYSRGAVRGRLRHPTSIEVEQARALLESWDQFAGWSLVRASTNQADFYQRLQQSNQEMHAQLVLNVQTETKPLWLLGNYRWLEIVFWVWFGVLTHGLINQARQLAGGRREEVWQPSELLGNLAKLAYAPVLALTLFFLASLVNSDIAALEFGRNSWATLGIAFTLGMFPNTVYRMLRQFLTMLFRSDLTGRERPRLIPRAGAARIDVSHKQSGGTYTLGQLGNNITELVTAPLKEQP